MLEVLKLTKIFKSSKNKVTVALDDVSFKLPDKGCAFIVGKSGSGKTTLLSLIGGLDDITSGEIIYQGNKLSEFKHNEFDVYRNNEVGFIFQDYHLLEELTIFDNIKMMLDFKNIKNDNKIHEALQAVGLKGYENRYPKELSGGEKQRVAIARIIVKDPSIILADEPTGNLDQKTTTQILELLKQISKTKLVLIVSHNKYDAYQYADYIFKLQDGKLIEKYIKKDEQIDNFKVKDDTLYISKNRHISQKEANNITNDLKKSKIKDIKQNKSNFVIYDENISGNKEKFKNKKNHIGFIKSLKYSFKFFKKGIFKSLIMSFILGVVISVASLCGNISNINKEQIRNNYLDKINLIDYKIGQNVNYEFIKDAMINEIKDDVNPKHIYKGYKLPNLSIRASFLNFNQYDFNTSIRSLVYLVDNDFLLKYFSINDKLEYVYKRDIDLANGFYLTDALLDNFYGKMLSKEEMISIGQNGCYRFGEYFKINGIIKTNLYEKYHDLLDKVNIFDTKVNSKLNKEYNNAFSDFCDEFMLYHNGLFTFNDNFYNDVIDNENLIRIGLSAGSYNDKHAELQNGFYVADKMNMPFELKDNEIILQSKTYKLFTNDETVYNDLVPVKIAKPIEINIGFYNKDDARMRNELINKTFKVVGISAYGNYMNLSNIHEICKHFYQPYGLFIENTKDFKTLSNINNKYDASFLLLAERQVNKVETMVSSLKNFFIFVLSILIFVILLGIFLYFIKSFNNNLFEIGVMKSLGARDKDIINMMLVNFIVTLFITLIIYSLLEIPLLLFSNKVLLEGVINISGLSLFNASLDILFVDPIMLLVTNLMIIGVYLIAFMVQFIKIRRLKPINIIKAKE